MMAAGAVMQKRHALGPDRVGYALHLARDELQRFVPADFLEGLPPVNHDAHQRLFQAVGVEVGAGTARTTCAKSPPAVQVVFIARDLPELTIFLVDIAGAFPETHVAHGWRLADDACAGQWLASRSRPA